MRLIFMKSVRIVFFHISKPQAGKSAFVGKEWVIFRKSAAAVNADCFIPEPYFKRIMALIPSCRRMPENKSIISRFKCVWINRACEKKSGNLTPSMIEYK